MPDATRTLGVYDSVCELGDVMSACRRVWIARIQKFTSTGSYVTRWGSCGSGDVTSRVVVVVDAFDVTP